MAFFTEAEKHFKQDILSYNTCKDIYRTSVMGKRVVEALVNFSLSAEREISIQKAPPEALERFNITARQMNQKEAIKRTIYNARIYGTGALYVALHHIANDEDDFDTKPNFNNASNFEIFFNVLDPQNISGSVVDTNPLSSTFLQLIDIKVDNQIVPRKRIAVSHAVEPLYLDQRTSLIPYSPPSVFYNMIDLLKDYDASIEALDNLLYKAGAIIYKYPNQKFSGITLDAVKKSAEILEQKRNGAVIAITEKCTVEDFPINNVNGLIESVNKLEDAITKALNDTPASLLFDKSLSNGFSEGDKDKETEISIIEAFRENKLTPLYTLTDYYVMLKAFDNDFINEMKDKYNDFKDKTNAQIFYEWANSFKYEFGNLFPEPESITIENNTKKLDNLLKLQQLGANTADIEAELNESGIFKQEIDLDGQQPDFDDDGMSGLSIDIDNPNNFRIDAYVPAGHEWKTLDNGEHVLINSETGDIVAGANYESWIENYKAKKRRQAELDKSKNADKPKITLSKEQYLKAKKDLKYTQELIDFHKRELEGYHPNDKMNREYKEREIAELESSNKRRQEAIAEYEKANPPVNAEKSKKEKPKKIGKTYSITYDNETIEKLKAIGKNWKDRRIYFKELDNGYYDLENDKWVTDSPKLTEKALHMASENETEKTARLEAEKREAERKAEEEKRIKAEKDEAKRRVAEAVRNRINSPSFEADFFNAMNNAGMFKDFDIPQGSINKITGEFFTDDELSAWYNTYKYSSDTEANLKDIVYNKVKKELDKVKEMYRPQKWGDWLISTKGIDNGSNTADYSGLEDMMDAYNYTEWEKEITRAYEDIKQGITKMSNRDAWAKYGDEFNKYKSEFKAGATDKMRAYVKEKLAGSGSDIKVDSKIDINNIDNDINILVDNLIRFVDKKDFDESKIKRDKDGKFAKKSGNKDSDNDNKDNDIKDNDDIDDEPKKTKSIKINKIEFSDIKGINRACDFVRRMENRTDGIITFNNKESAKDYLSNLPKNDLICGNLKERLQNIIDGKSNNKPPKAEIDNAIKKLPKGQQKTAGYVYNDEAISQELYDKYFEIAFEEDLKEGESVQGKAKRMVYNDLDNGAKTMYGFSSIKEYKYYSKEADAEIINLINNNPHPKTTVYRGESITLEDFNKLEIGKPYSEIKQSNIKSSNASYNFKVAMSFADEEHNVDYINVIHIFNNTKHIKGSNLSYYVDEDECYIDKTEQILDNVYKDDSDCYYCVYKSKED